ncbi:MAG: Com family DNA-binding transcriptional regulator [Hyphomonadaceae bacterium]
MPQKDMSVIDAPASMDGVLIPEPGTYALEGEGDITYRCGSCKTRLLSNVSHFDVMHDHPFTAVKCPKCGKFNDLPPEDKHHHH